MSKETIKYIIAYVAGMSVTLISSVMESPLLEVIIGITIVFVTLSICKKVKNDLP